MRQTGRYEGRFAMSSDKQPHTDKDYSFESVPLYARKNFWSMFFIMLGFTFFSASMSVGATMGNGLDLSEFIFSVIAGGIILAVYTGVLGYIGCGTGLCPAFLWRGRFPPSVPADQPYTDRLVRRGGCHVRVSCRGSAPCKPVAADYCRRFLHDCIRVLWHPGHGNCQLYICSADPHSGNLFNGHGNP